MTIKDEQQFTRESVERYDPQLSDGQMIAAEHQARYRWAAMVAPGKVVLDAGCGVGYGSAVLAEAGATRVVGLDVDPAAIADASSRYATQEAIEFTQGDLRELPFDDSSFDLVVCFETIEHIDRQDTALDELRRVVRNEGHLLLSSPNRDVFPPGNPHHVHEYTPEELGKALADRFEAVDLWRQHTWLASVLMSHDAASGGPETEVDASVRKLTKLDPGSELYTLAIAGNTRLTGLRGSAMLGEPVEIRDLVWLQHQLEMRTEELHESRQETADAVAGYESSFSWRVTKPFRGAKRFAERAGKRSKAD